MGSHFHSSSLPPPALHTPTHWERERERHTHTVCVCVGTLSLNTRPIGRVSDGVRSKNTTFFLASVDSRKKRQFSPYLLPSRRRDVRDSTGILFFHAHSFATWVLPFKSWSLQSDFDCLSDQSAVPPFVHHLHSSQCVVHVKCRLIELIFISNRRCQSIYPSIIGQSFQHPIRPPSTTSCVYSCVCVCVWLSMRCLSMCLVWRECWAFRLVELRSTFAFGAARTQRHQADRWFSCVDPCDLSSILYLFFSPSSPSLSTGARLP